MQQLTQHGGGISDATSYLNSKTAGYKDKSEEEKEQVKAEVTAERDKAREKRAEAYKRDPNSDETKYWQDYVFELDEWLKWQ